MNHYCVPFLVALSILTATAGPSPPVSQPEPTSDPEPSQPGPKSDLPDLSGGWSTDEVLDGTSVRFESLPSRCTEALNAPRIVEARRRYEVYSRLLMIASAAGTIWKNRDLLVQFATALDGDDDAMAELVLQLGVEFGQDLLMNLMLEHHDELVKMAVEAVLPDQASLILSAYAAGMEMTEEYPQAIALIRDPKGAIIDFAIEYIKEKSEWNRMERALDLIVTTSAALDAAVESNDREAIVVAASAATNSLETMYRFTMIIESGITSNWFGSMSPQRALRKLHPGVDSAFDRLYEALDLARDSMENDIIAFGDLALACGNSRCGEPEYAPKGADEELLQSWPTFECRWQKSFHTPQGCYAASDYARGEEACPGVWGRCCEPSGN